jgi:hypothetical protein
MMWDSISDRGKRISFFFFRKVNTCSVSALLLPNEMVLVALSPRVKRSGRKVKTDVHIARKIPGSRTSTVPTCRHENRQKFTLNENTNILICGKILGE